MMGRRLVGIEVVKFISGDVHCIVNPDDCCSGAGNLSGMVLRSGPTEICGDLFLCCADYTPFSSGLALDTVLSGKPNYVMQGAVGGTTMAGLTPAVFDGSPGPQKAVLVNEGSEKVLLTPGAGFGATGEEVVLPHAYASGLMLSEDDAASLWRDGCSSGGPYWRLLNTTVPPFTANASGGVRYTKPLEICDSLFWCCKSYVLPSASIDDFKPFLSGRAPVYALSTVAGTTTITGMEAEQFGTGFSVRNSGVPGGTSGQGPQVVVLTNVQSGSFVGLSNNNTGSVSGNRFQLPAAYSGGITMAYKDTTALWMDVCTSGWNSWRLLFTTVAPTTSQSTSLKFAGARVFRSTNQTIPTGAYTPISFDNSRYNTSGFWAAGSGSWITILNSGFYAFGAGLAFTNGASAAATLAAQITHHSGLVSGGLVLVRDERPQVAPGGMAAPTALQLSTTMKLDMNDGLKLQVYQDTGSDLDATTNANFSIEFWINYLGN